MVKRHEMMSLREEEIFRMIAHLCAGTGGFEDPKIVVIGGYALRAFTSLSRYTRDCDLVLRKPNGWSLDRLQALRPPGLATEALEKRDGYGFMRCIRLLKVPGGSVKIAFDFMEGEVRGRAEGQAFLVTEDFMSRASKVKISIAGKTAEIYVPDYPHYLILKLMSARPSDIRDIATLAWKKGVPGDLKEEAWKVLPDPGILEKNLELVEADISHARFLDSWRGTFATTEFTQEAREKVLAELRKLR